VLNAACIHGTIADVDLPTNYRCNPADVAIDDSRLVVGELSVVVNGIGL